MTIHNNPDSKQEALKPCSFCNGVVKVQENSDLPGMFRIACRAAACKIWPSTPWYTDAAEVVALWNTHRASVAAVEGDALDRILQLEAALISIQYADSGCDCEHVDQNCCAVVGEFCGRCWAHAALKNNSTRQSIHPLFTELLSAFDATRMGEKGVNQGCWCVQSPINTSQPDWKHNKECKRNMKLLRRCLAVAPPKTPVVARSAISVPWNMVQAHAGTDVMTIAMDAKANRLSASGLMEAIASYAESAYRVGRAAASSPAPAEPLDDVTLRGSVEITVFRGDKVLAVNSRNFNGFCGVGGKVEAGETFEQAARRELMEETGCEARSIQFIAGHTLDPIPGDDQSVKWYCAGFVVDIGDQEPRQNEEGTTPFWTTKEDMIQNSLFPVWYSWWFGVLDRPAKPLQPTGEQENLKQIPQQGENK